MGVIRVNRIFRCNAQCSITALNTPGVSSIPVLIVTTIRRGILKVAVLNQFGIQAAVRSIVDILKKDTNQMLADLFRLTCIHLDSSLYRLEVGKTYRVLLGTFSVQ